MNKKRLISASLKLYCDCSFVIIMLRSSMDQKKKKTGKKCKILPTE